MDKTFDVRKIFGNNLKNLRENKNLTQEQLAESLNLQTYQTINRIENGRTFVTRILLEKICKFFNIEPYVLFLKPNQKYTPETLDEISQINQKLNDIYNIICKNK